MIGKTSRAVAKKYARPTTPKMANTAKDTFSTVMPSSGLRSAIAPQYNSHFVSTALTSTAAHELVKTGENFPAIRAGTRGRDDGKKW